MDQLGTKRKEIRCPERMAPGFFQDVPIFTLPLYIYLHFRSNRGTHRYFQVPTTGGCTGKEQQGKSALKRECRNSLEFQEIIPDYRLGGGFLISELVLTSSSLLKILGMLCSYRSFSEQ